MKTLLMLTKFYPFGSGEAFIENEIEIIAGKFDRVILIACDIDKNVVKCRKLPENVKVIRIDSAGKLKDIAGIASVGVSSEDLKKEFSLCRNLKEKLFAGYFESKSRRIYNSIIEQLDIDELRKDDITLYSYWMFVTARVGIMLKRVFGNAVKYSFTRAHRYDLYADRNSLSYLPMRVLILHEYDRVYPCSNHGTEYLKTLYNEYASKIEPALLGTIDNGTNKGSEDGIFRIVSCSRMENVKRVERIIESLSLLGCEKNKVEWTHIGGGSLYDKLKAEADKSLQGINYVFKGDMPNTEVMEYYRTTPVDLFLNVSSSEGLPVSIMEAISFGIPVIATDVGGTSEIVIDKKNGYLIPEGFKNEELAGIIKLFLNRDNSCDHMRKTAREFWEENFMAIKNYNILCESL